MANHVDHQRIDELTANAAKALRRSQALRRWGQRLTVVSCAAAVLAFVISASALWHRLHHHGHAHKHRYTRHRSHLPSWMHFPGAVKLKDPAKGPKKEKFRLPWQKSVQKSFWQSFYSPERGNAHGHPEHPHAHHGPHPEHHQGAHHDHGHGHADHAGHGHGHGHHSVTDDLVAHPRVFVAEIVAVVFLSTIFETWEHWLRHRLAHQGRSSELRILDCLFKEVTCLGFIGLVLYLVHRLSIVDTLASKIFMPEELEDENPLFETFELVHMMIFLLLIVLLFQAAALLPLSHRIVEKWRRFERTTTWGQKKNSFESMLVKDGYLSRQARPSSPRGVELTCIKPFIYGSNWWERLMSRRNILVRMISWRMLRHEFLFPGSKDETPDPKRFKHAAHKGVSINPSFFSFEGYLRGLLSNTVVALVEVDMITWSLTLLVLIPLMYSCVVFSVSIEFLQCSIAWLLLASAAGLVICLEEDLYALTPELPEDARQILRLFSGTSIQDFQRTHTPDGENPCRDQILGAPGLGDADSSPKSNLRRPTDLLGSQAICTCETYRRLLRLVAFWQALCVTSLVVAFLSHPFARLSSVILHLLAWAEWPLMLFWIWPMLVRKLTMRYSLDETKDQGLIRAVSLHSKESLLRHHLRLVQVFCFYRRAAEMNEPWANVPCPSPVKSNEKRGGANEKYRNSGRRRSWAKAAFTKADAEKNFSHGKHLFQGMGDGEQEELWDLFELLDADGDMSVDLNNIVGKFKAMGLKENPETAARGVLRLVEHSGNHAYAQRYLVEHGDMPSFTWETFSSMMALTTTHRPAREMEEDLSMIFRLIDKASPETVTVFEITEWMRGIKRSLTEADVASVLHKHFCEAKPTLTRAEFVEWFQAISGASDEQHAGHGHGH